MSLTEALERKSADETGPAALHRTGFEVADFPLPTGREEDWRFSPLDRLTALLTADPAGTATSSTSSAQPAATLPAGVLISTLAADDPQRRAVPAPIDRIGVLALACSASSTVLRVPAHADVSEPIHLVVSGQGDLTTWGHLIIDVGAHARATVVVEHRGAARHGALVSVLVADGAQLEFCSLQTWQAGSVHAQQVAVRLGRDATVRSTQASLGGAVVRTVETVEYAGPGGDAQLHGLYVAGPDQHLEHRLFVDHAQPHCRSSVVYKGALRGQHARTVWVGDVLIRAGAEGTDTYEINRNLLLSDGARADSVPNLEIETGEIIGAGHASATGRFDDEQLFYLQARGIPPEQARRLVVHGFFAELVQQISTQDVAERLMAAIDAFLAQEDGHTAAEQAPIGAPDTNGAS